MSLPGPLGNEPRINICIIVICADTDEEAQQYNYTEYDLIRIRENRKRMIVGSYELLAQLFCK
ncbi:MAG: hypothetical protein JWM44_1584 [Bacilli bacterium]|jgi:alkanesulfonate monooxygenase SsuD/methylene tetrahydromethanopterin reductase-like flavin-dependent oxidoreductase (luciferase family)|nr:hypothetical protein [Bacilli bacterium]